jgi:hypothetical protein
MPWDKRYVLMEPPAEGATVFRIYDWTTHVNELPRPGKNIYGNLPDEVRVQEYSANKVSPVRSVSIRLAGPGRETTMYVYQLRKRP